MDTKRIKAERRAEEAVKEESERALEVFEDTRNESVSAAFEASTEVAAEQAVGVIKKSIAAEQGSPSKVEEKALRDMEKVIEAEERAQAYAAKNDLFFEDREAIKAEEAAADAEERTEQYEEFLRAEN